MHGGIPRRSRPIRVVVGAILIVLLLETMVLPADAAAQGFSVRDGRLLDVGGSDFVMRGVNHPHAWFPNQLGAFSDIDDLGANTVRVVLSTGDQFQPTSSADLSRVVDACKQNQLVCVLEVHDTTGGAEVAGSITLNEAVQFWKTMQPILEGQEAYVIINIGNEPFGNLNDHRWTSATTAAVEALRSAGFTHTLMVDAPNWGQDWTFTMRDHAKEVLTNDPLGNVIFDVHMYGVFDTEAKVRAYIESFVRQRIPLVIGEFGATHTDGDPDEDAILQWAETYGIGYLGWSWSGNTDPVGDLDIVEDFQSSDRSSWGERLIDGEHGIAATAAKPLMFGGRVAPVPQLRPRSAPPAASANTTTPHLHHRVEAEDGVRNGTGVSVKGAGFASTGYVTGFDAGGDSLTVDVHVAREDRYDLVLGYRASYGHKTQHLYVNGVLVADVVFPASRGFTSVRIPDVDLSPGSNSIMIESYWGWFDLDFIEVWDTTP